MRFLCVFPASSHLTLDDFVEMTKKYAQGVAPSPVMAAAGGDDDDDDDEVVVRNPDELPLQQKVRICTDAANVQQLFLPVNPLLKGFLFFLLPSDDKVPPLRFAGDQGAPHRLGVAGWHAVAQRSDPHTPRQRTHLLLYYLQPHNRILSLRHSPADFLPLVLLHGHLHPARISGQCLSDLVVFNYLLF